MTNQGIRFNFFKIFFESIFIKTMLEYFLVFLLLFFASCSSDEQSKSQDGSKSYHCPMHPQVVSDKPGVCPICQMDLVLSSDTSADTEMSAVVFDNREVSLAGIETTKVTREPVQASLRVFSIIDYAEQNRRLITAKASGRIEKLFVRRTGDYIYAGTPLFELYSPALIQAQQDYIVTRTGNKGFSLPDSLSKTLRSSARQRLLFMGMTEAQLFQLDTKSEPFFSITVYASANGQVIAKPIQEGAYVTEGDILFELADFSVVWNIAEVPAENIQSVSIGSPAEVTVQGYADRVFKGFVQFIDPVVNPQSRTVKVRIELLNLGGVLKPQMIAETSITTAVRSGIVVPKDAVVQTGKISVVWVQTAENTYKAHEVIIGALFDGKLEILSGLQEGDIIASSGGFLIDSESQLSGFSDQYEPAPPVDSASVVQPNREDLEVPANTNDHAEQNKNESLPDQSDTPEVKTIWNAVCPVLGDKVNPRVEPVLYQGKWIGFCCKGCDKKFISDPGTYFRNLSPDGKRFIGVVPNDEE